MKPETTARGWKSLWALLACAFLILLIVAARSVDLRREFQGSLEWIADRGDAGMLVFALLYVLSCLLLIPASVLTVGGGAAFGLVKGLALVSLSSILGATAAFLVSRHFARDWVARKVSAHPRFAALDRAVAREGWKIVGLTRLSPFFPFCVLNYAYGLTRVSLRDYVIASWIGMTPATVLYVYAGAVTRQLVGPEAEVVSRSPAYWIMTGVGLAATVAVTFYTARLARRALMQELERP